MEPPATFISRFLTRNEPDLDVRQLSPVWAPPRHANDVTIYIPRKVGHEKVRGYYDATQRVFRKVNGAALPIILGWTE